MGMERRQLSPSDLRERLIHIAVSNVIKNVPTGTKNDLANSGVLFLHT